MNKTKLALAVSVCFLTFAINANAISNGGTNIETLTSTSTSTATASGNTNTINVGMGGGEGSGTTNKNTANGGKGGNAAGGDSSASVNVAASKSYHPPVSSAYAPTVFPTAPCMGSSSAGVSTGIVGLSLGSTWTSEECLILETARAFDQAGYGEDGLNVRCQAKYAKSAPSCKALAQKNEDIKNHKVIAVAPVVVAPVTYEVLPEIAPNNEVLVLEPLKY